MQQQPAAASSSDQTLPTTTPTHHPLDQLLAQVGTHAAFSPLVARFEIFPVESSPLLPPGGRRPPPAPREVNHDTLLLVQFRSARARDEWIRTREWREFMERTERDRVFRRLPHVRCAPSLRGLGDPMEVLGI
jgi:hypothetical protein